MNNRAEKSLVLFDGVCNLCEGTVRFIIRRDRDAHFQFAALQSEAARRKLEDHSYAGNQLDSVLLIADGKLYQESRAGLQIAKRLDGAWPLFYYLLFWVPRFIADPVYRYIGNRRYRWFGQKEECWIPTPDLRRRFLDDPVANDGTE